MGDIYGIQFLHLRQWLSWILQKFSLNSKISTMPLKDPNKHYYNKRPKDNIMSITPTVGLPQYAALVLQSRHIWGPPIAEH
jgi:hypothetical protein